jgi:beta-exotoxin I transport system permease protein
MRPLLARIAWEHRVRLPLIAGFALAWGFLIVTFYAHADTTTQTNFGPEQIRTALRIFGGNWLAIWVGLGMAHPLLLAASGVIACGTAVRSVAGELEGGTLELVLSRPVERTRYLAAYLVFTLTALAGAAALYAAGAYAAWRIVRPDPGSLSAGSLARAAICLALLLFAVAGYSLLCSAFARERGRALGLAVGLTIGLYAWNFLASLVGVLAPFARISPWYWFNPAPVLAGGGFPYGDALVLAGAAVVCSGVAMAQFVRRDL